MAKLNPLAFARTLANKKDAKDKELINQLIADAETLQRRIDTQEEEFRRTNDTLRQELYTLLDENAKLKKNVIGNNISTDEQTTCKAPTNCNSPVDSPESSNHKINDSSNASEISPKTNSRSLSFHYSDLVEKEALENELGDLRQRIKQLESEKNSAVSKLDEMTTELSSLKPKYEEVSSKCNERQSLIQEMKDHMSEMSQQHSSEVESLKNEYESQLESLKREMDSLKSVKNELIAAEKHLESLSIEKSDLQVQLQEARSKLEEYKEKLTSTESAHATKITDLTKEFEAKIEIVKETSKDEIEKWQLKHLDASEEVETLKKKISTLNQKVSDGLEERKINEKKGMLLVKEIKKQLATEKKRADKLQSKLQELLAETPIDASGFSSTTVSADGKSVLNDSASTSSWSFMSNSKTENFNSHNSNSNAANARRPSSLHSFSDPGKDSSPTPVSPSTTTATDDLDIVSLVDDNAQLISRIAELQQEKWRLDERINHLQIDLDRIAKESQEKSKIIEFYCMEGRSDHLSGHAAHNSADKLTVKRVVDFIKDRGDEGQKEINRKLQRLLEETLTKNMYLQKDLESLSNQLVKLKGELTELQPAKLNTS